MDYSIKDWFIQQRFWMGFGLLIAVSSFNKFRMSGKAIVSKPNRECAIIIPIPIPNPILLL